MSLTFPSYFPKSNKEILIRMSNEAPPRPYLRARRRVRQRVDAGEPRNSYSSIPGFSFRSTPHFRHHHNSHQGNHSNLNHHHNLNHGGSNSSNHNNPHPHHLFHGNGHFPFAPFGASGGNNLHNHHNSSTPSHFPLGNPFYRPIHFGLNSLKDKLNLPISSAPSVPGGPRGFFNPALLPPNRSPGSIHPGRPLSNLPQPPRLMGPPHSGPPCSSSSSFPFPRFPQADVVKSALMMRPHHAHHPRSSTPLKEEEELLQVQQGGEDVIISEEEERRLNGRDNSGLKENGVDGNGRRCRGEIVGGDDEEHEDEAGVEAGAAQEEKEDIEGKEEENVVEKERAKENTISSAEERRTGNCSSKTEEESSIGNLLPRESDIQDKFNRQNSWSSHHHQSSSAAKLVYFKNLGHAHDSFFGLRDLLHGKLALAAAAYTTKTLLLRHQQQHSKSNMEPGLSLLGHHDFRSNATTNNNNNNNNTDHLKDALVSHFLKVRQEMSAMRVSKPVSDEEETMDQPMDLVRNEEDSGASPRSTSSDAGLSSSSAGKEKSARLENIVSSMRFTPGSNKRKLYQPVQVDFSTKGDLHDQQPDESTQMNVEEEEEVSPPESKKEKMERNPLVEHLSRVREKLSKNNDENADPIDRPSSGYPTLPNTSTSIPPPPPPIPSHPSTPFGPPALQFQYMEMARRFIQEQQDKITKETITKDILNETIHKNNNIANKLAEISPELQGLAEILKSEITASLAVIIESIVGRFLHARRTPLGPKIFPPPPPLGLPHPPISLDDGPSKFNFPSTDLPLIPPSLPPPPIIHAINNNIPVTTKSSTPSGRAPQVRDRAVSRNNGNPMSIASMPLINTTITTSSLSGLPLPPSLRPAPSLVDNSNKSSRSNSSKSNNNISSNNSSCSNDNDIENLPEQDEALSLVVTPKKPKRHKVTDTRITPRTVSRVLNNNGEGTTASNNHPHHNSSASNNTPPLFPPTPMSDTPIFPGLPTSVAIPNPSLTDFHRFHNTLLRDSSSPGSPDSSKRHDRDSPSSIVNTMGGNGSSPDLRHFDVDSDEFDRVPSSLPFLSGFSLDGGHSATLTPMHLRKAKLMFFWVRYPSSAILKMYFPDIKFNKNNTAQLVKWFSNFREFFYIQMEKYARQALSEGIKNSEDLHVTIESELYRVINLHYNRNNHIEVPARFRWVVEQTLCEFFKAIQIGKDSDPSWKKQIYKVIARLDDYVPEYFKSQTFLDQLE
nr:uncharacterized protein LOC121115195 isoform X2 [Lepeophtheirus salmonis]